MKKIINWIAESWKSDTPIIAKFAQIVLGITSAVFVLWATMPEEFKGVFTPSELKFISISSVLSTVLLQLLKSKDNIDKSEK